MSRSHLLLIVRLLLGLGALGLFFLLGQHVNELKRHYERPRPSTALRDGWVWENNTSFPSGHSSSSLAVFGLLGYLSWRRARTEHQRFWCVAGFGLLIFAIGFSRVFLCAHFV